MRVDAPALEIGLSPDHEEGVGLVQSVQSAEVQVAPVHHIIGSGFHGQDVEGVNW
jgi:hypothetical protein